MGGSRPEIGVSAWVFILGALQKLELDHPDEPGFTATAVLAMSLELSEAKGSPEIKHVKKVLEDLELEGCAISERREGFILWHLLERGRERVAVLVSALDRLRDVLVLRRAS